MFPGEIAADLRRFYGIRIADWHQGVMCSYELLELCEYMPDDGAFKTACRDGEPNEQQQAILQIANETAVLRASQAAGVEGDQWGSRLFIPAYKLREMAEQSEQREESRGAVFAALADRTSKGVD
jgi:hypothetical protein